jgi:RNA polymerase sigma factor (TIGR02999 family)
MPDEFLGEVTLLLRQVSEKVPGATDRLFHLVYPHWRDLAHFLSSDHASIEPTDVAHDAFIRLFSASACSWESRRHFFGAAALAMRHSLLDHVKRLNTRKRGGGRVHVSFDDQVGASDDTFDLILLDEAMKQFELRYPDHAEVVMLKYFGHRSREEIAQMVGRHPSTVWREWQFARAWLQDAIEGSRSNPDIS